MAGVQSRSRNALTGVEVLAKRNVTGPLTCNRTGEKTWRREVGYCTTADGVDVNREILIKIKILKLGNRWPFHDFFALLISRLFNDYGVRRARDHSGRGEAKNGTASNRDHLFARGYPVA
jgi:hypothetical protein